MLKRKWLEIRIMENGQLLIKRVEGEIIKRSEVKNDKMVKVVKEMKKVEVCHIPSPLIWKTHLCGTFLANNQSLPSTVATFLTTHLTAVLQPSGYSIFHGRDTSIQLDLL